MSATNTNNAVLKINGTDISGEWTDELNSKRTTNLIEANRGAGATHVQRLPALRDNDFTFMVIYSQVEAERIVSLDLVKDGDRVLIYWAPEGDDVGMRYFEGYMYCESVEGPNPKQDKTNMFVMTYTMKGDGAPIHELTDAAIV